MRTHTDTLVRLLGFPATLIHGDTLVLDRWLWLRSNLPWVPPGSKRLLDIGCGSGAFTLGAARLGYRALGLSWDAGNQEAARVRASLIKAQLADFEVQDVRQLDQRVDLCEAFDVILCCENIEHILDDAKLVADISRCLKPGGTLLLTTPNSGYRPISSGDRGPFVPIDDGRHVRKGYSAEQLTALCLDSGLVVVQIDYCSWFVSQKLTAFLRACSLISYTAAWCILLPLRLLPPILDPWLSHILVWPGYSITLKATKPNARHGH